jgi:hypothetical protein
MEEPTQLQIALEAADAGNAGHWPTVAGILADAYREKCIEADTMRQHYKNAEVASITNAEEMSRSNDPRCS